MKIYLVNNDCRYAAEQMMLTLFPAERPEYPAGEPDGTGPAVRLALTEGRGALRAEAKLWWAGSLYTASRAADMAELTGGLQNDRVRRRALQLAFYDAAIQALGTEPPWGALTGVRPVKLPTKWLLAGEGREGAKARLTGLYHVRADRAELAMECAEAALRVREGLTPDSLALYVGVPFCPTRCAYCSFVSADVRGSLALVEPYVDALCEEISLAGRLLKERDLRVSAAYMGGGTPTTLSAAQLDRVLTVMGQALPLGDCEFTVEAGRPDTITAEKLSVLRTHGAGRISINPQTMEDAVLRAMGRSHTAAQIEEAMALADEHFGGLVNMDLIAGLPADTAEGFSRTLGRVLAMGPANVTVHTLALKKGSRLTEEGGGLCPPAAVAEMLKTAETRLRRAGYAPYYLYRQKYMSGSFENVGWCRPGTACAYNIIMMEELQTVLSLGAGGVTKLVNPRTGKVERLGNPKYPREYLDHFTQAAADKKKAVEFQRGLARQADPERR